MGIQEVILSILVEIETLRCGSTNFAGHRALTSDRSVLPTDTRIISHVHHSARLGSHTPRICPIEALTCILGPQCDIIN